GSRAAGVAPGARIPGKININTVWDEETIVALVDAQQPNSFYNAQTTDRFAQQVAQRLVLARRPNGFPTEQDRPFWGLGLGRYRNDQQFGNASGVEESILRSAQDLRVGSHPHEAYEALNKIANQITTRSNVFAVWITVGFFEVKDEDARPVKLG